MPYAATIACSVLLTLAPMSFAKNDKAKGPPPRGTGASEFTQHASNQPRYATFSQADNTLVRVYFAQHQVAWSGLPPGIAKNYARGKKLPPGISRRILPADLQARLPTRRGYDYARVGQDVVLIERATEIVVDVIERVFG
jgi:Ni/Co efflux regulator RcnB